MAYETGTASDVLDLFDKLVDFLTTNADLITAGEEWSVDWTAPGGSANETARVLVGQVPSGDTPKIAMQVVSNALTSTHEIHFNGLTNVLTGATLATGHTNCSEQVRLLADNAPMTYWFTANGRRFIVAIKVSTVFESAYCGLFLPYALPNTYPSPVYVAASAGFGNNQIADWRSLDRAHACAAFPSYTGGATSTQRPATAYCLSPAAQWEIVSVPSTDGSGTAEDQVMLHPQYDGGAARVDTQRRLYSNVALGLQVQGPSDVYAAHPITLFRRNPANQTYGVLDGMVAVQGRNNAAENDITVGADEYLVLQDTFRTVVDRYSAMLKG